MNEFLIDGLWIMDIDSGLCFFEENYVKWSLKDTQLISSFLAAIRSFTKEAFSEDIEFIQFRSRKIIFELSDQNLFIVAVSDPDASHELIRMTVKSIVKKFNSSFHYLIKNKHLVKEFKKVKSFSNDLQEIVNRKPLNVKLLMIDQIERHYKRRANRRMRRLEEIKRCM
ncbi:MAG: hypothetical protein JW891_17780 [Candidatus Lokiarchaeota archaeon]|nr:hypothetical protein [Candidatus Lokiarchaeota archaeon]